MNDAIAEDVLLLMAGGFGAAVAEAMADQPRVRSMPITEELLLNPLPYLHGRSRFVAFVGNRPLRRQLLSIDDRFWGLGIAWTACELNDTRLLLGPNIVPGVSPCFRCCSARYRATSFDKQALADETAFERHSLLNPDCEVHGFTPAIVQMAALHIRLYSCNAKARSGLLREISLPDLSVRQGRAVPLHGCRLCRPTCRVPEDRFVYGLKAAIRVVP